MNNIDAKSLAKIKAEATRGTAESTRLWNYQIRILLHFAVIGMNIGTTNKEQRETINALLKVLENGLLND